jgi:hypothetical protein
MPKLSLTEMQKAASYFKRLNDDLALASPGARIEAPSNPQGLYTVYTPSRPLSVFNIEFLDTLLKSTVPMGEQSLIITIELSQWIAYQKYCQDNLSNIRIIKEGFPDEEDI